MLKNSLAAVTYYFLMTTVCCRPFYQAYILLIQQMNTGCDRTDKTADHKCEKTDDLQADSQIEVGHKELAHSLKVFSIDGPVPCCQ